MDNYKFMWSKLIATNIFSRVNKDKNVKYCLCFVELNNLTLINSF